MEYYHTLMVMVVATALLASSQELPREKRTLHGGVSVGAKVSAWAGGYSNVQRPLPVVASPYVRSYPAVVAPIAPYQVARPVVVSVPQTVAVPVARPYYGAVPAGAGQTVAGIAPYYYYPYYSGYGSGFRV